MRNFPNTECGNRNGKPGKRSLKKADDESRIEHVANNITMDEWGFLLKTAPNDAVPFITKYQSALPIPPLAEQ